MFGFRGSYLLRIELMYVHRHMHTTDLYVRLKL